MMDDQSLETFYNRGIGSITGTSLGVEAIGEFQLLTNTYGAPFGSRTRVMNSVSKSGNNDFHGSLFYFIRNSDLDARNFNDPASTPEFRRNQYGATFGGPIKKDKLFFFANYEGIQSIQGVSNIAVVPYNSDVLPRRMRRPRWRSTMCWLSIPPLRLHSTRPPALATPQ